MMTKETMELDKDEESPHNEEIKSRSTTNLSSGIAILI